MLTQNVMGTNEEIKLSLSGNIAFLFENFIIEMLEHSHK